ncbi:MAG: glutamine--fructose-6-phosphate transaminase (isomerizing) [Nitrospinae bacterium]|nr:glutamine--fructose-6-phosphate transaminase (isomerizing) [Nitrospinota bacterium]
MCGISGIVGFENISKSLLNSIRNLEYRGYDSCGIAILEKGYIKIKKNIGYVDEVNEKEGLTNLTGRTGIAHTRWATHGGVTKKNAHPHISCKGDFAVVHNGIISNYHTLKEGLKKEGHKFLSETDTEVIAHLLEKYYSSTGDVEDAFRRSLNMLDGTYAIAMITIYEHEKIFCAKNESPLILGIGNDANYVGSDFNAFIDYTKNTVVLDDKEYAVISKEKYIIKDIRGERVNKEITMIGWDAEMAKKGGYPHYMLKEIYEQPQAITNAMNVDRKIIKEVASMIMDNKRTYLTGVGTTYYVSLLGEYYFSSLTGSHLTAVSSDEFRNLAEVADKTLVIAISQSGETYDTLNALKYARKNGAKTVAIVNVIGSSIARMVDIPIMQGSGPEICVISTKAAISQMIILLSIVLELGAMKKKITVKEKIRIEKELRRLPTVIQDILNEKSGFIHNIAHKYSRIKNWLYLGRGIYYPIALESALKMKEVAYIHAEGMPGGFLKHGTIALIDENLYTVGFIPPKEERDLYPLIIGGIEEVKARNGFVMGFHFGDKEKDYKLFDEEIILPKVDKVIAPFLQLILGQLFAYFTAISLKRNIDKPRSLAKSVTVA